MTKIYIAGIAMTRFDKMSDHSVKDLTAWAVNDALKDAGIPASRVKAAMFANTVQGALEGQLMVGGQIALRPLGFEGIPIINMENACASSSTAFHMAANYIKAGAADVVLAVGADKMVVPDKKAMFGIFDGAWDIHDTEEGTRRLLALGDGMPTPEGVAEQDERSFFMDVYASFAKAHMHAFGTTQRQIAAASAKNHTHSSFNPLAQYRKPMTTEEVLAAPTIVWPYTLPMCAPVSDGAAAAILCSEDVLAEFDNTRCVEVLSSQLLTGISREGDAFDQHLCHIGAQRAYEEAGIGPQDISVCEVHDATAFAEIQQIENLMFTPFGDGGGFVEDGQTSLGGKVPVNTSGGLESKGHPIAATGLGQLYELATQLRGEAGRRQVENASFAMAENGGGLYGIEEATASLTILAAPN